MLKRSLAALALGLALGVTPVTAQQPAYRVDVYALKADGRTIRVLFRVADPATGRDIAQLQPRDLRLREDGALITPELTLNQHTVEPSAGSFAVDLAALGGTAPAGNPVVLKAVGATIGIVHDSSIVTNRAADPVDYVARGQELIVAFLEAGRAAAPDDPEALGLYVPLSVPAVPGEVLSPTALALFGQDRNAVINVVRQQPPRARKTNLFDSIRVAVGATAVAARQRGSEAYLLLVTDGADVASSGSYDALLEAATSSGVRLLILGVGPEAAVARGEAALKTMAESTGGAYLARPEPAQVQELYRATVIPTLQTAYTLTYRTDLLDDGAPHYLTVGLAGDAATESTPIPLPHFTGDADGELRPLGAALQGYALRALPVAVLVSLLCTALLVLIRRAFGGASTSLSGGITRR